MEIIDLKSGTKYSVYKRRGGFVVETQFALKPPRNKSHYFYIDGWRELSKIEVYDSFETLKRTLPVEIAEIDISDKATENGCFFD